MRVEAIPETSCIFNISQTVDNDKRNTEVLTAVTMEARCYLGPAGFLPDFLFGLQDGRRLAFRLHGITPQKAELFILLA
jgi:hypothetical protein